MLSGSHSTHEELRNVEERVILSRQLLISQPPQSIPFMIHSARRRAKLDQTSPLNSATTRYQRRLLTS